MTGHVTDHHRFLLGEHLTHIRHLEQARDRIPAESTRRFISPPEDTCASEREDEAPPEAPSDLAAQSETPTPTSAALRWTHAVVLLSRIPGISERSAIGIFADIGTTRHQFPTAAHLASWAGMVRCITRLNIPGAARKNSKGGSWVHGFPHTERVWGTGACH